MSKYTCNICGEAIPCAADGTILSYRHWLECSYNQKKKAYETLNLPIPATAHVGYGLRLNRQDGHEQLQVSTRRATNI